MQFKNHLKRCAPTLLTIAGGIGVIATAILSAKATPKAIALQEKATTEKKEKLTLTERVKVNIPVYFPAICMGVSTIGCIFGANFLNQKQLTALTSAYALVNRGYSDYKRKVKELYGEETHQEIMNAITLEKCEDAQIWTPGLYCNSTLDYGEDDEIVTFYDAYSERYFESTVSRVLQAEYHLNRNFVLGDDVNLNTFYGFLGIPPIDVGDETCWDLNDIFWIDFNHYVVRQNDGMEVHMIEMICEPSYQFIED